MVEIRIGRIDVLLDRVPSSQRKVRRPQIVGMIDDALDDRPSGSGLAESRALCLNSERTHFDSGPASPTEAPP